MSPWAPLGCAGFSDFTCLWCLWQFCGALVRYFAEGPSVRVCLMFFSWLDWRLCVWRRKITEGKCRSSHLWTRARALEPTYCGWSVPWSPLRHRVSGFFTTVYNIMQREVTLCSPHCKGWKVMPHLLEGRVCAQSLWNASALEICPCSLMSLFQSYLYISIDLWAFHTVGYNSCCALWYCSSCSHFGH